MLNWLIGGAEQQQQQQRPQTPPQEYADPNAPETPAALFAVKAFRTAIFGTPAPTRRAYRQDTQQPQSQLPHPAESASASDDPFKRDPRKSTSTTASNEVVPPFRPSQRKRLSSSEERKKLDLDGGKPFQLQPHTNIFEPKPIPLPPKMEDYQEPPRPMSPTKGILMTPGANGGRRKAVTFDSGTKKEDEAKPTTAARIRSGIPADCPGKFPSPWTPRTSTPRASSGTSAGKPSASGLSSGLVTSPGSLEETSLPTDTAAKKRGGFRFQVTEYTRIEDILKEEDDEAVELPFFQEGELTADMTAPKSASGKYWKDHAENIEGMAVKKIGYFKERYELAFEYAKRKDEFCVNLSEKIREYYEKNRLLKDEIKRLNRLNQFANTPEGHALEDAMRMLQEKEARISQNEEDMAGMQLLLDQREQNIAELSMSMYGPNGSSSESVEELKKKLRQAREEVKELGPLRAEYRISKTKITQLEKEKENLKAQLDRMKSVGIDESRMSVRSTSEVRLRSKIEELEKEKRDLKAEIRSKQMETSKERRDSEKTLRSEIADLKAKIMHEELDRKELATETERQKEIIQSLEMDLIKATSAKTAARFAGADNTEDWQKKHDEAMEELRLAREEIQILKQMQPQRPTLSRFRNHSVTMADAPAAEETKEEPTPKKRVAPSRDSGTPSGLPTLDRSLAARSINRGVTPRKTAGAIHFGESTTKDRMTPRKVSSSLFGFDPKPYDDLADSSVFTLPPVTDGENDMENTTPQQTAFNDIMDFGDETFASMKRLKASPRPAMVHLEMSPSPTKRRNYGSAKKPAAIQQTSKPIFSDPARQAAAEKRLAERKAKRMAQRNATEAK
ncbi:hypothetical protein FPQ18DRAFT_336124 [Pyronema domesticum]|uniref:Spindle pole body-associated protein cut12 domain-containing protein n=1 Tax=Pyronema omphalodes (strain CBS 100304) TaxID=1076935 RepID=U4LDY4_PYROM|nr:hypothetical protein FPQ18DRAFT_336124 [Pyronema domesticum]CCX09299.1 Similar to hypothetical protein [Tuber melanosporum Mel28]; acc. no. XP_002838694 [Pyronema omphalodes CBS 100304]